MDLLNLTPDKKKALFYAKRDIAQIVTDVVNLEEINYTVPEVNAGYPMINVSAQRKAEFHKTMIDYYNNHDLKPLNVFLKSCLNSIIVKEFCRL